MAAPPLPDRSTARSVPRAALAAPRLTALDAAFIGLLALTVVLDVVCAVFALGWPSAAATDAICALYVAGMALARPAWRPLLARLFALGLAAGVVELFTDFAGERVAHSLIYPAGEPLLWGSPYYMPLSWAIVFTQLGYLAWRLRPVDVAGTTRGTEDESAPKRVRWPRPPARASVRAILAKLAGEESRSRVPLWLAVVITGLAGAALVPFYEEMAWYAHWWRYTPVALLLGHTPLYVLVFEGAVAALLPLLVGGLLYRPVRYAAALGLLEGAWMPVAALLAWLAVGR